ncbi:hypothetical protein HYU09_05535 [Candidatus Woesearchaeota archaeon]|nr:hypothetical protein [Candidatus Woesearchaeota archaeon]
MAKAPIHLCTQSDGIRDLWLQYSSVSGYLGSLASGVKKYSTGTANLPRETAVFSGNGHMFIMDGQFADGKKSSVTCIEVTLLPGQDDGIEAIAETVRGISPLFAQQQVRVEHYLSSLGLPKRAVDEIKRYQECNP